MADISEHLPPKKRSRVSRYPHGAPRDPDRIRKIARLRDKKKLQWRAIGPMVGMSGQGACLLYNHWKEWLYPPDEVTEEESA